MKTCVFWRSLLLGLTLLSAVSQVLSANNNELVPNFLDDRDDHIIWIIQVLISFKF